METFDSTQSGTAGTLEGATIGVQMPSPSVVTRLCALDTLFAATGTVDVRVMRNGKDGTITLPIQSVDNEMVEALVKPLRPKLPTRRDMIDGQWKTIINEADPAYQDKMTEYNRAYLCAWAFCALACDIVDETQTVVWSKDNSVHDLPAARAVLRRMGLVENQLLAIMQAARNLTAVVEGQQAQD